MPLLLSRSNRHPMHSQLCEGDANRISMTLEKESEGSDCQGPWSHSTLVTSKFSKCSSELPDLLVSWSNILSSQFLCVIELSSITWIREIKGVHKEGVNRQTRRRLNGRFVSEPSNKSMRWKTEHTDAFILSYPEKRFFSLLLTEWANRGKSGKKDGQNYGQN